jgi:hypothetical protein
MNKETAVSEEQNFYCEKLEMQKQRGQRDNLCKEQCDTCKNLHIAGRRQDRQIAEDAYEAGEAYGAISVSNHYNEDYPSQQLPLPPNKAEYLSRFNSGQSETEKK